MTRLLTLGLAVALLAHPAHADSKYYEGGCGFNAVQQETATGPDRFVGVLRVTAVLFSTEPTANPQSGTVTCYLAVDGVRQPQATLTVPGIGVVAGAGLIGYTATDEQYVELCQEIRFGDDPVPVFAGCHDDPGPWLPPNYIQEFVDNALELTGAADETLCPVLAAQAGTYGDAVTVDAQGDVAVAGELFWDCPPYE